MSSTPPSEVPPPPPPPQPSTQIVGQQSAPSTAVPHTPGLQVQGTANQTNTMAIISLVAAIGSFFAHIIPGIGGFTVALIAVITGFVARNQIKQTGESGMGLATAAIIIGFVHMGLLVIGVIALILIFIFGIALFGIAASHSS